MNARRAYERLYARLKTKQMKDSTPSVNNLEVENTAHNTPQQERSQERLNTPQNVRDFKKAYQPIEMVKTGRLFPQRLKYKVNQ